MRASFSRGIQPGHRESSELVRIQPGWPSELETPGILALVRRLGAEERRKRCELEVYIRSLESLLESGQKHIDHLEAKAEKAVTGFRGIEAEFRDYRAPFLVRAARKASQGFRGWQRHMRRFLA